MNAILIVRKIQKQVKLEYNFMNVSIYTAFSKMGGKGARTPDSPSPI